MTGETRRALSKVLSTLPIPMQWRARRAAQFVVRKLANFGVKLPYTLPVDRRNPLDGLTRRGERQIWHLLGKRPWNLLEIREVRQILARERLSSFLQETDRLSQLPGTPEQAARNTLEYNLKTLHTAADLDRPMMLIRPLLSIGRVARSTGEMKVLSIGPRSEIEIFGLIASGFAVPNITGLDLFSYSPFVDVGDMHALPYANDSFDIVLLGWVLVYSKDQPAAAREVVRCCRHGGVVAIAADYSDASMADDTLGREQTYIQSCEQLLSLFGDSVGQVYFRHEADGAGEPLIMVIFELKKQGGRLVDYGNGGPQRAAYSTS
jgi:hypothetical protein